MMSRRAFLQVSATTVAASTLPIGCATMASDITAQVEHRPWPLPKTRWVLFMRWHDLLFLHWPVRPELIRPLIPEPVELETFDGWAWIGIIPFYMTGVRPRYFPLPFAFPELNVRTYVKTPGRSGVWFFSLDATSWLSVRVARWFGLPYYDARMSVEHVGNTVHYQSVRTHAEAAPAEFNAAYRPTGTVFHPAPGTFDHWLTERYSLYAGKKPEQVVYGDIHHPPWLLQPAEVELRTNTMTQQIRIALPETKPVCHFARLQEVVAWPIVPIKEAT
jgi:uncharacterized protein